MATRTAPAFTSAATSRAITLRMIDVSGDFYAESLSVAVAATAADIEAYVAAYQATTKASIYEIIDGIVRTGDADPDNADTGLRSSVADGTNLLFKTPAGLTQPVRQVAPVDDTMQGNQDIPLLSATVMGTLITSILALKSGFSFARAQFTERRERKNNPVIR